MTGNSPQKKISQRFPESTSPLCHGSWCSRSRAFFLRIQPCLTLNDPRGLFILLFFFVLRIPRQGDPRAPRAVGQERASALPQVQGGCTRRAERPRPASQTGADAADAAGVFATGRFRSLSTEIASVSLVFIPVSLIWPLDRIGIDVDLFDQFDSVFKY